MSDIIILGFISLINLLFLIKFKINFSLIILSIISLFMGFFWIHREGEFIAMLFFDKIKLSILVFLLHFSVITTFFSIFQSIIRFVINFIKKHNHQ